MRALSNVNRVHVGYIGILMLLGFLEFRLLTYLHDSNFDGIVKAHFGIIDGHAYWRAFQNKLLGPYMVYFIQLLTGFSPTVSLKVFFLLAAIVQNIVCFLVFLSLSGCRKLALNYTFVFIAAFVAFQDESWLFAWDYIDIVVLFLFSYGVFSAKPVGYFALLFLMALSNRETALFIPVWMILNSIKFSKSESGIRYRDLFLGGGLLLGGAVVLKWTRDNLFVQSNVPEIGLDLGHRELGNHLTIGKNLQILYENVAHLKLDMIANLLMLYLLWFIVHNRSKFTKQTLTLMIVVLGLASSVFLFGVINETRTWLNLIPPTLVLHYALAKPNVQQT